MQIRLVKMAGAYSKPFNINLFWYYIKQIMNVFIRAMVRIFSFGERWNVPFNSAQVLLQCTWPFSTYSLFHNTEPSFMQEMVGSSSRVCCIFARVTMQ
jgi:hypothetical protein